MAGSKYFMPIACELEAVASLRDTSIGNCCWEANLWLVYLEVGNLPFSGCNDLPEQTIGVGYLRCWMRITFRLVKPLSHWTSHKRV